MKTEKKKPISQIVDSFLKENACLIQEVDGFHAVIQIKEFDKFIDNIKQIEQNNTEYYGAYCCLMTKQKSSWSLEGLYNEIFK